MEPDGIERDAFPTLEKLAYAVAFLNRYAKVMDTYGGDVAAGLIPVLGDATTSLVSSGVQLGLAWKTKLPFKDQLKILLGHGMDLVIGAVPLVGDVADYFYKSNVYAKNRFVDHFQKSVELSLRAGSISAKEAERLRTIAGVS